MKDEDMLKLLLAFVLGFMVCKVSRAGQLVEGKHVAGHCMCLGHD